MFIMVYTCGSQQQIQNLLVSSSCSGTCWAHASPEGAPRGQNVTNQWNFSTFQRVQPVQPVQPVYGTMDSDPDHLLTLLSLHPGVLQNPNHDGLDLNMKHPLKFFFSHFAN